MGSQDSPWLELGEATTFPFIVFLCMAMGPAPKCHFVPGLPSWNPKIPEIGTFATLEAHNFLYRPLIEMRFKKKL